MIRHEHPAVEIDVPRPRVGEEGLRELHEVAVEGEDPLLSKAREGEKARGVGRVDSLHALEVRGLLHPRMLLHAWLGFGRASCARECVGSARCSTETTLLVGNVGEHP